MRSRAGHLKNAHLLVPENTDLPPWRYRIVDPGVKTVVREEHFALVVVDW